MAYQITLAKAAVAEAHQSGDRRAVAIAKRSLNKLISNIAWGN